jgi:uncharacterized phage infection (PIP) family protein YhgE
MTSIAHLNDEMERCATRAQEIEDAMQKAVDTSVELEEAMSAQISEFGVSLGSEVSTNLSLATTTLQQDKVDTDARDAQAKRNIKNDVVKEMERRVKENDEEFREARTEFYKTAKKGGR